MFVVTLKKAGLKKVGVGVICCALVVFSAVLGRYISGRSVMAAAAASGNKIESAQDIQTWFTGYGLDVDAATIAAEATAIASAPMASALAKSEDTRRPPVITREISEPAESRYFLARYRA